VKASVRVRQLPQPYRAAARAMCHAILRRYPRTAAFIVIGSVADGSWQPDSDLDLVWVLRGRRRRGWREELDYHEEGVVELVPLELAGLKRQFAWCSPMAHAIQRGVVLYDRDRLLERFRRRRLGPPTREWMRDWFDFFWRRFDYGLTSNRISKRFHRRFCRRRCVCKVSEVLHRAVLNLARLLLATAGLVPNSKAELRRHYPSVVVNPRLRRAMETALAAHHAKRELTLREATELVRLGRWLRRRLVRVLGKPGASAPRPSGNVGPAIARNRRSAPGSVGPIPDS
jgi:hypothetical protein